MGDGQSDEELCWLIVTRWGKRVRNVLRALQKHEDGFPAWRGSVLALGREQYFVVKRAPRGVLASLDQVLQKAGAKTLITRCPANADEGMTEHEARVSAEAVVGYEADGVPRFCEVERVWVVPFSFPWALDPAHPAAWKHDDPSMCIDPSWFSVHVYPDGRIDIPMVL